MASRPSEIETLEWKHGSGSGSASSCSGGDICRICHCESDPANPLLAPCYCSGSLKYVHQHCLQQWLTASDTRSCELCKFHFVMHAKIKPFNEWRGLDMSGVERRRLCCAVLFHCVAALCVMWSLFVLIERAAEEIQKGHIAWPFWTKLVVVAVGFTGGAVFMYIQCRQYFALCSRWRCHNRILLIQNAPEKVHPPPPSPRPRREDDVERAHRSQIVASIENDPCEDESGGFDDYRPNSFRRILKADDVEYARAAAGARRPPTKRPQPPIARSPRPYGGVVYRISDRFDATAEVPVDYDSRAQPSDVAFEVCDPLELNIREMLELDAETSQRRKRSVLSLNRDQPAQCHRVSTHEADRTVFKSLPNLSASSESLLPPKADS